MLISRKKTETKLRGKNVITLSPQQMVPHASASDTLLVFAQVHTPNQGVQASTLLLYNGVNYTQSTSKVEL